MHLPSSVAWLQPYFPGHDLENFRFHYGELPMSTWPLAITPIVIYLTTIFVLQRFMENRKRFELTGLVLVHNAFLSILSLVMLAGAVYECLKIVLNLPSDETVPMTFLCDPKSRVAQGPQVVWFYIFYLSKFYELLDTVIIVLKKNKIIFLHVYHHCITIILVFVMLDNEVVLQWCSIIANAAVHVPMYFYYALSAAGMTVWWKKYITTFQICQFVTDLVVNSLGFCVYYSGQKCSGSLASWWFGQFVLLSFLVLFILFYKSTYSSSNPRASKGTLNPEAQSPQQSPVLTKKDK